MKLTSLFALFILCLLLQPLQADEKKPARDILGLRLSMSESAVKARLKEIGSFERAEPPRQEVWKVRDSHFSAIAIGFNKEGKLRYILAAARTDKNAKPMAYTEVGDLKKAHQAGDIKIKNFIYEWELPARGDEPKMTVIAMGRDPKFLNTLKFRRLGEPVRTGEDDD